MKVKIDNRLVLHEDFAEIIISSPCSSEKHILIDLDDVELVKNFNWCAFNYCYYYKRSNGKPTKNYLHRVLMNCPDGMVVDHINGDKFDNRKSNLRICTQCANLINSKLQTRNKTGARGTYFDKTKKRWFARFIYNKKVKRMGGFLTMEEANNARIEAEVEFWKNEYRTTHL